MRSFLLLLLIFVSSTQDFNIYPDNTYKQLTASSRACYANCQFCQIKTGFCEECLSPYFQKDVNGNCVLVNGYIIQSSQQQLSSGSAFTPSNVSWSLTRTTTCTPNSNYFQSNLKVLGPFTVSDGTITYRRSVSSHKYMKLKFFLLKTGWTSKDSLTIIIRNQDNIILSNQTINYSSNIPLQILCSTSAIDQRFSLSYDFQNIGTTSLFISFIPNFQLASSKWAVSTFLLLTGRCHDTCDDCYSSLQATKCKNCKNFFIQGADGTCNQCADGFKKVTVNGLNKCQKCSIQYKQCQVNNQICWYNSLASQLNTNCTWNSKLNYVSEYYLNSDQFSGSLFSVNGISSTASNALISTTYKCGDYSIVGLANRGESITRIFTSLHVHQSLSLTFNIFIVDQQLTAQKSVFEIYIDNSRVETLFINSVGLSSICGGINKEVFQTYPATKFFPHNNIQNVNITIRSSNTIRWGIRNFRLSLHVCDENCAQCGPNGCITCLKYYSLSNYVCAQCPASSSPALFQQNICYQCSDYCLSCIVSKTTANQTLKSCTKCQQGYFVYQGLCQILPNVGQTIYPSVPKWKSPNQIVPNSQCTIDFKSEVVTNNKKINFLVAENSLTNTFIVSEPHYKMLITFYLLKIDNWLPGDELHLYLNDLLVMRKSYGAFGNKICYQASQNDIATYEQFQIQDNNQTLTAYFEVVSADLTAKRKFGISQFQVNPVACQQCNTYDFSYKVQYNYDQVLTVQVIFNRLYINSDPVLFKTIFILQVNGQKMDYDIVKNDSIRYFLQANPASQIILSNITVYCKYPQKVTTDIYDPINQEAFFEGRIMQQSQISKLKSLSNTLSTKLVERFTPLSSPSSSNGIRIFFEVVTRMVIYIGFFSFFIGCLTPCTHFMHNIQKIWLHIYIAALTMPNLLRLVLTGFRQSQDQNIAINPTQWQVGIPQHLYYDAPAQYQDYYHDITFFRNIYNIGFAAAIYLVFSIIMYFLFRANRFRSSNNKFVRHMKITFNLRPYFVFNSVIFYQYITICIACTLQFIDLSSNTNQTPFKGINSAAAIICFVLATAYPILHFFYLSHKQKDMYSINTQISFRNRYHQIFYRFLPKNLWKVSNSQFQPISFKQRFYNLLRFGQIWWFSIIFALMYGSPFAQAFLLLITNFLHLAFLWISSISYTRTFKILKVLQLGFFVALQIIILVCYQQNETLTTDAYRALGIVGVVFIFIIVLLSFIRFIYTLVKIIRQYKESYIKSQNLDQRLRNDDFYASFENESNNERIVSEE